MVTLVIGLVLLSLPFLLVCLFYDKKQGFVYVLFFSLVFQSVLGILTQTLGIFYYWLIVSITFVASMVAFFFLLKLRKKISFNLRNIDWVVLFVAIISILCFWQIHYNYTGKINIATDQTVSYHEVKNMIYQYPYFSDEWYAVSLVGGSINNHSLPLKNTLDNTFFPNLEIFFHSFIAEIMLFLGLSPLLHYTILSIFLNALIIILIYLFLRISKIPKLTAGICSLLALFITYGANLPGLWHLIPLNSGIIFFLLSLCFMEFGDVKTTIFSVILASLFYPPLVPFYFVGLLVFLLFRIKLPKGHLFKIISTTVLSLFFVVPITYILLMISSLSGVIGYILSRIFFVSFTAPNMPQLDFYNIIPAPAILLAVFGLYYICKNRKWILLSVFGLGAIYWFINSLTLYRFFSEYERIVILTSIITVIISGFGLKWLEDYIETKFQKGAVLTKITEIAVLLVFLILIPFYTQGERWMKIILIDPVNNQEIYPKSPANNYLTQDDLKIFGDIKGKRFLSIPWKGTVIGVATGNHPISTKPGTISIGSETMANVFLASDCRQKANMAKDFKIDYIYIYKFDCSQFQEIGKSEEGLVLYQFNK